MVEALERPLLLPKDMDALKPMRQPDLFLSLKRDLALVSSLACFTKSVFLSSPQLFMYRLSRRFLWPRSGSKMLGLRPTSVSKPIGPWEPKAQRKADRGGEGTEEC